MEEQKHDFVEEVIKKKPNKGKRLLSSLASFMSLVFVFGIVAALIIFLLRDNLKEMIFENERYNENQSQTKINLALDDGDGITFAESVSELEEEINRSIVSVYRVQEGTGSVELLCTGVIMSMNEHVYILVPYNKIKDKEDLTVMFYNETMADAVLWNKDSDLGIAVIRVDRADIDKDTFEEITFAVIGGRDSLERGYSFVYEGNPFSQEVLTYVGNIAGVSEMEDMYDIYFRYIYTDVAIANVEDGFLFDANARLTGMVLSQFTSDNYTISAVSLYDIYDIIYGMLNRQPLGYMGVQGEGVGYKIKKYINQDMPDGLYITSVDNTSPAYQSGIMSGDIITAINDVGIENMEDISQVVNSKRPGDVINVLLRRKIGGNYKDFNIDVIIGQRK